MTFDRAELENIERRELHLTVLSAVIVLVLAGGVALLMYPLVFVHPQGGNIWSPRFAFIGFCVLSVLFVGYLLDRHRTVRQLKQRLLQELDRNLELKDKANMDLLHTIPNLNHLQDRLTMEIRRAASAECTLSFLVVKVNLKHEDPNSQEARAALGEAAREISKKLRATDSIYLFGSGLFGLVLPGTDLVQARRLALRLDEVLRAVGVANRFTSEFLVYNYPEDVKSAHELEGIVSSLQPESQPWLAETTAR